MEERLALKHQMQKVLDRVGREHLSSLLLHIDGFSYKEICLITGSSMPAIKSQIFRAKEKLRQALLEVGEPVKIKTSPSRKIP